jgi:predicted RecB family nuclease
MKFDGTTLVLAATDLSNFLACRRKLALELSVARGDREKPDLDDPVLEILRQRGAEHEARFVDAERAKGFDIVDVSKIAGVEEPTRAQRVAATLHAMRSGAPRIVQAALQSHDGQWFGYADVLRRVDAPGFLGPDGGASAWSYEAIDTKLAQETRAATMLQLSLYSALLGDMQGVTPECFYVVTPVREERYRVGDFGAYFRLMQRGLTTFVGELSVGSAESNAFANAGPARAATAADDTRASATPARDTDTALPYPEPVAHCDICNWRLECTRQLRHDDHLSFVANCSRAQRTELATHNVTTLASLGRDGLPTPFQPKRGSTTTYERLQHQARLQLHRRDTGQLTHECLPLDPGFGLGALPEPRPGDLFLDLEGDPFGRPGAGSATGEGQREYLFGLGRITAGGFAYTARWAFTDAEERQAFSATMADIMAALDTDPYIHIYHYAPYEPAAFKRLMGRYATCEDQVDRLLRGHRFVDLYSVIRRGVRAGVERYSIKDLEPLFDFTREVDLRDAGNHRRLVELALETSDPSSISTDIRAVVEGYNRDDVRSAAELRAWLETVRETQIALGADIPRPSATPDAPSEKVDERAQKVDALRVRLLDAVPIEPADRTPDEQARHLLAYLLDFHRREDKAEWWEYFRLCELPEADLIDEPKAVACLEYAHDVEILKKSVVQRYRFPEQEIEIRAGETLKTQDGRKFAETVRVDRQRRTIDLLVGPSKTHDRPTALFAHDHVNARVIEDALFQLGEQVADAGGIEALPPGPAQSLLVRQKPRLRSNVFEAPSAAVLDYARAIVLDLDNTALAIQGPPGAGKTFTGARMIEACVANGWKVGVTAGSHKVIRNLLKYVDGPDARVGHKCRADEIEDGVAGITLFGENDEALAALQAGTINVLGGTAWLWARPEFAGAVDVLFVDEAGQMSLANTVAVTRAARNIVLLGDPQQLDQPSKGSHPDGVGASALQHVLGDATTMPPDRGLFLPITWRLAPSICAFTSELFYAGALRSKPGLERQSLKGSGMFDGAGLWILPVDHSGNRNASSEEAEFIVDLVDRLMAPGSTWTDETGQSHQITAGDIRIITPFNAQVVRLRETFELRRSSFELTHAGTVDKFQGQEAAVSIYSMATSHPEDAPRGMEFLYSLNRLNVATSRARCASVIVANTALFAPGCSTPRQMQLANALALYREMAAEAWLVSLAMR